MSRYLVVAHQTVTNPLLLEQVRNVRRDDPTAEFVLLVPATPVRHLVFRRGTDEEAHVVARRLADKALAMFAKKGIQLEDARVGSESPTEAIAEEMRAHPVYTGFIISTLPRETSHWLKLDLANAVETSYGLPVHHVVAPPDWSAGHLP